jgi:hypothetical protein
VDFEVLVFAFSSPLLFDPLYLLYSRIMLVGVPSVPTFFQLFMDILGLEKFYKELKISWDSWDTILLKSVFMVVME